jgi:2-haloacid dehalogenase
MRDLDRIGRRPVLAGIGAATLAAFCRPTLAPAEALDRAPRVLVFDVAESLLDLRVLRPLFQRVFGDGGMVDEWFGETILYSETATLTNTFVPFGLLGAGVFRMLGRIHNVSIGAADVAELGKGLASLPPHPDAPDSLRRLNAAGYRLVTLTDSPAIPGRGPLQAAGLADLFEHQFTAETVRRYKPARETYQMVAQATAGREIRNEPCKGGRASEYPEANWTASGLVPRRILPSHRRRGSPADQVPCVLTAARGCPSFVSCGPLSVVATDAKRISVGGLRQPDPNNRIVCNVGGSGG